MTESWRFWGGWPCWTLWRDVVQVGNLQRFWKHEHTQGAKSQQVTKGWHWHCWHGRQQGSWEHCTVPTGADWPLCKQSWTVVQWAGGRGAHWIFGCRNWQLLCNVQRGVSRALLKLSGGRECRRFSPSFDISLWTPNVPSHSWRLSVATMRHFCSLVVQTLTQPNHYIGLHITPGNADLPSGCLKSSTTSIGVCSGEACNGSWEDDNNGITHWTLLAAVDNTCGHAMPIHAGLVGAFRLVMPWWAECKASRTSEHKELGATIQEPYSSASPIQDKLWQTFQYSWISGGNFCLWGGKLADIQSSATITRATITRMPV